MTLSTDDLTRYPADGLRRLATAIFAAKGSEATEADIIGRHLVDANLAGHDSHGVKMIPAYLENLATDGVFPNVALKTILDSGGILAFDGGLGYGQRMAQEATAKAIERCRENGSVIWSLRHSHHVGRIGDYGEQVIEAGLVGLFFVNVVGHDPTVAPFGGRESRFGTNPVCIAIPGSTHGAPLMLDFATSRIAYGKVEVARNKGVPVPEDCLVDGQGRMTTDPGVMFEEPQGAQLSFGEHKGSGLALMCEVLAGALSGGFTIQPEHHRQNNITNNIFSILIRPDATPAGTGLSHEVSRLVEYVKSAPLMEGSDDVLVAGEPEVRAREDRSRNGIPLDEVTYGNLLAAAESAGISPDQARELVFG